jgi:hypothetical protein
MSQLFYLFGSNIGILLIHLNHLFNSQPENSIKKPTIKVGFQVLSPKTIIILENNNVGMTTANSNQIMQDIMLILEQ